MNSTTKNTIWVMVIVVVIVGAIWLLMGKTTDMNPGMDATNTPSGMTNEQGGTSSGQAGSNSNSDANAGGSVSPTAGSIPSDSFLTQVINTAKIRVPQTGVDVALSAGSGTYTSGAVKGTVSVGALLGKVTTTDGYDVFVPLTLTSQTPPGQSTVNSYVALFHVKGQTVTYTSAVLIGNQLPVQGIEASDDTGVKLKDKQVAMDSTLGYILKISYLDRKNGEPSTATPTLPKDVTARVKNHVVTK